MAKVQFDRITVIEQSTVLFWRYGFNGTSMQQIFSSTGLKPGSLYLAFGNKEELFRQALLCYANNGLSSLKKNLLAADSVPFAICQQLIRMTQESLEQDYCSCFLLKSQLELASENSDLCQFIQQQIKRIEDLYRQFMVPIYGERQASIYAVSLMLHIFGIRVYGYHKPTQESMLDSLRQGLAWLPWADALD